MGSMPLYSRVQRRFKVILLLLLSVATAVAVWFSLSVYGYTSDNAVNVFLSLCFQYFFTLATIPIYYEAAVEATFPVPEGTHPAFQTGGGGGGGGAGFSPTVQFRATSVHIKLQH